MSWIEIKIISLDDCEESESRNILTLVLHGSHIQDGSGGGKKRQWMKRGESKQHETSDQLNHSNMENQLAIFGWLSCSEPPNLEAEPVIALSQFTGSAGPK